MPTLSFFPWATITERLRFSDFHVAPLGEALASREIPARYRRAVTGLLRPYGYTRASALHGIPVLRHEARGFVDELAADEIAAAFEFSTRLAFTVLAKRQFFDLRYTNSDHVRLIVQGFVLEGPGAVTVVSRRRDGSMHNMISRRRFTAPRPAHVSGACELPRDLDRPLLVGLEAASSANDDLAERLADAVRLFVGANTDNPGVGEYAEVIDLVSAFARLADSDTHVEVVRAFIRELPPPVDPEWVPRYGPKATSVFMAARERKPGKKAPPGTPPFIASIRQLWLEDAHVLRHQHAHGKIRRPHTKFWSQREHLLLGAVALPLYVKALLRKAGCYAFTVRDDVLNLAFDTLATVEPFAAREDDDGSEYPWRDAISHAEMYGFIRRAANKTTVTQERDADGRVVRTAVSFPTELPEEE